MVTLKQYANINWYWNISFFLPNQNDLEYGVNYLAKTTVQTTTTYYIRSFQNLHKNNIQTMKFIILIIFNLFYKLK